jgi:crossover junction endodeoxyribonuclease RuvC
MPYFFKNLEHVRFNTQSNKTNLYILRASWLQPYLVLDSGTVRARDNQSMRIFGVDPGTATTGYGILDTDGPNKFIYIGSGIVQTKKDRSMAERLQIVRADILSLIQQYKPDIVVIEQLFFFRNATTVIPVAQARGVILEAAATCCVPVAEYTPMQVKMHLTGYGKADKKLVQFTVAKLLGHDQIIKPDDAADAVALAVCHARLSLNGTMAPSPPVNLQSRPAAR